MLKTKTVFLDTSVFISSNYQYLTTSFQRLVELVKGDIVKVCLTDITINEIKGHIIEDVNQANHASQKFRDKARILRNLRLTPYKYYFEKFDSAKAIELLIKQLADFIKEVNTEIISANKASVDDVFEQYFEQSAPFSQGKKKSEFPDAFVLSSLENWCKQENEKIYIISDDGDMEKYCKKSKNLFYLNKLSEFLELINLDEEILTERVIKLFEENQEKIEEKIGEEFTLAGFWLEDQEGDVENVKVTNVDVLDKSVINIDTDECEAEIELDVHVDFEADVDYDDMETAIYDSEDKVLIPWDKVSETVTQERDITAIAHIKFSTEDSDYFEIDYIKIHDSSDIPINTGSW